MKIETIKEGVDSFWDSIAEGWHQLRESAANALTHFKASEKSQLPDKDEVDDPLYVSSRGWSMLGGEVFEDSNRIVVRLEVPGLEKQDMEVEVRNDTLVVSGEKRFERENTEGRWRVMQCAYGSFRRVIPLPAQVITDQTEASYINGVLRVVLPKAEQSKPKGNAIKIS